MPLSTFSDAVPKTSLSMATTKALFPDSKGRLEFIAVDLADLTTIRTAAVEFLGKEKRLNFLVNNAGVEASLLKTTSSKLGHYLLTSLLLPALTITPNSRILWAGSLVIDLQSPHSGITFISTPNPSPTIHKDTQTIYAQSRAAALFLAIEFRRRYPSITSVCFNPGSLDTELLRHTNWLTAKFVKVVILHPAIFGAYTELGAGWGNVEDAYDGGKGWYGIPWGKNGWSGLREDILVTVEKGEAGEGLWKWCERETLEFL